MQYHEDLVHQDQDIDLNPVVETLVNMFGNLLSKEVIYTVVESCDGDLNLSVEAIMNITSDGSHIQTETPVNEGPPTQSVIMNDRAVTTKDKPVNNLKVESSSSLVPLVYVPERPSTSKCQLGEGRQDNGNTNDYSPQSNIAVAGKPMSYAKIFQNSTVFKDKREDSQSNDSSTGSSETLASSVTPRSTGAVPKQPQYTMSITDKIWSDQMRLIIVHHNQGARILLIMRGAPGSGKTYAAKQIVDMTVGSKPAYYERHIYSTDDYFSLRGSYQYDRCKLSEAHAWNQNRVKSALEQGVSPVIIDNTNIELWEMEIYVRFGVLNGYIIEIIEPKTPWAKKASQLARKNIHNVPIETIKRMLGNFRDGVMGSELISSYGFTYPPDMTPPVLRNIPEVVNLNPLIKTGSEEEHLKKSDTSGGFFSNQDCLKEEYQNDKNSTNSSNTSALQNQPKDNKLEIEESNACCYIPYEEQKLSEISYSDDDEGRQKRVLELQKRMEEIEKVEQEWENGETWDEEISQGTTSSYDTARTSELDPKPPRKNASAESSHADNTKQQDGLMESVKKCNDWNKISLFMPPWYEEDASETKIEIPVKCIVTQTASTCIESGDTDISNSKKNFKIITATPRDINLFHLPLNSEKIPQERMLDKSSMTNELLLTEAFHCKNEEQHFIAFRKMFKNIPKADLRDIFEKCCGDVNWAVDIVLEGMDNKELKTIDYEDLSETEEESSELCECVAAYQVIPDKKASPERLKLFDAETDISESPSPSIEPSNQTSARKTKTAPSESLMQLKRQIEENFVISDDHYSKHCLRIRNMRRGEVDPEINTKQEIEPVADQIPTEENSPNSDSKSDDEESIQSSHEPERTININLGKDFITQLDKLFGREGMKYPEKIEPRINIPVSLLSEINAFWMESLMHQFDGLDDQSAQMVLEDAEFARQLEIKEAELKSVGKEPEVPDFKEIMDMDLAMSLYQKDIVAEWRNKEPNDIAAKMTRDKLYNLFPDMSHEILSELLMAHDNNFKATVEVLLMSTGKTEILLENNGLNKFVMKKEMERHEKLLEEEKKALSEFEWPPLPQGEKIDMAEVNRYRLEAEKHLVYRNIHLKKAQDYIRRGMTQVANYYSDAANLHKQKYEQSNSMAAVTLAQYHASKSPDNATIDLHFLRVGEAKESLDLFLDTHIMKLKEMNNRGPQFQTLFFITGRGLHSKGKPRIKPAIKKRLVERGLV